MYILELFLASLMITFTNGETRMITPNFKAVNFAREIRGRRLNGSVIREMEVDSEGSCRLQCVEESACLSYNFGPSKNKKRLKCQLSDSDRFAGLKNFTEDDDFLYRGVKVILIFFLTFKTQRRCDIYLTCVIYVNVLNNEKNHLLVFLLFCFFVFFTSQSSNLKLYF